jgi:predicted ATPase/class 3 adenylate cyclase
MQCAQCQHENAAEARFCNQCATPLIPLCLSCGVENALDAKFCNQCATPLTGQPSATSPIQHRLLQLKAEIRFHALLPEVTAFLQRNKRVTYHRLRHIFGMDDVLLEELRKEFAFQQMARDEQGEGLVWTGEIQPAVQPAVAITSPPATADTTAVVSSPAAPIPPPPHITETNMPSHRTTAPPEGVSTDTPHNEPVTYSTLTRSAPEGERRHATVVFSDLSGYTTMGATFDPEEVEALTSRIKQKAVQIVERHGGIVNQFVGDEVLALFGIPTAHEDDPVRAIRAAIDLHALVRGMSPEVEDRIGRPLRLHTGINTGLIVTNVKDHRDGTFGITGDVVNTGARLAAHAAEDTIVVSPDTHRLIADFFDTEALEPVILQGKVAPIVPHRVIAQTRVQTRFEAAKQRGFTPFTGREQEFATLHACLDKALAGVGQFVTVMGEGGAGKSRLLYEFRHSLDRSKIAIREGRCQSYGQATPYLPWVDAARRTLQLRDDDSPAERLDKTVTNTLAVDPSLERFLPHYLHLFSIPSDQYRLPAHLQGEDLKRALEEALAAPYTLYTQQQPMVVIFEDWHWADEASDSALKYLISVIAAYPILLIVLYRPSEYQANWGTLSNHTAIHLSSLSAAHTESIIKLNWATESLPNGLATLVHAHSGGNPFFIEELCNGLLEDGSVEVRDRGAILTRPLESLDLPDSVQAVIRSRLDRLDSDTQEVLRLASVIGREFASRVLASIQTLQKDLDPSLDILKALELIQQTRVVPEVEYMFKHVITQQVTYETLLVQRRKELHDLVGRAIETLYANRLEEQYEALAYHFSRSHDVHKAVYYLELAGDKAERYFSMEEARTHYRAAIDLVDSQPDLTRWRASRIELSLKWARVSHYGATDEHVHILETTLQYARELDDTHQAAKTIYWIGRMHYNLGNVDQGVARFEECAKLAEALNDDELLALALNIMGRSCLFSTQYAKGFAYLGKGIPLMERLGNLEEVAYSTGILASLYGYTGQFCKAYRNAKKALELSQKIANKTRIALSLVYTGFVQLEQGSFDTSIANWVESATQCQQMGNHVIQGVATGGQGYGVFMMGDSETGLQLLRSGIDLIESTGSRFCLSWLYGYLAECHALAGNAEDAVIAAEKCLALRRFGDLWKEQQACRALALAAALEPRPDWRQIDGHIAETLRLAEGKNARPDVAITCLRYAELLRSKGDRKKAQDALQRATALFQDMAMTWWFEKAEKLRTLMTSPRPSLSIEPPKADA